MPILSAPGELVFLLVTTEAAGAGALAFAGAAEFAFLFVSAVLPQASTKRPVKRHIIKRRDLDISVLPEFRMAKRADNITLCPLHVADSVLHCGPAPPKDSP